MDIEVYAKYQNLYTENIPNLLVEKFIECPPDSFGDIGCGDGALVNALIKNGLLDGAKITCVDLSAKRLENAKKNHSSINIYQASAEHMPNIDSQSLDFICSQQVIEHVGNDFQMLKECHRVLKNGGCFYLSTVFKKWYGWYFYRCNGRWVIDPTHVREYTKDSQLTSIIASAGFHVVSNLKTPISYSLIDFFVRRLSSDLKIYERPIFKRMRALKICIPGYYNWELILKK